MTTMTKTLATRSTWTTSLLGALQQAGAIVLGVAFAVLTLNAALGILLIAYTVLRAAAAALGLVQ